MRLLLLALAFLLAAAPARAEEEQAARFAAGLPQLQAELLRAAEQALSPQRPGVVDLYVVAVAGSASADVFLREARAARALFDDRFDAAGRSVLLANNQESALETPLASAENLRQVVRAIAARMDPGEDVLALYFTSHGKRGSFSLRFPGLAIGDLTPPILARILDEAGVAWRVVILSACHSGSFIPALEGERTLVLTASSAARVSFGCADENDFTYFGKALIDEELRRSHSLIEAFEAAKGSIAAREKADGYAPSMPQAYVGDAIRSKLAELEARLKRRPAPGG